MIVVTTSRRIGALKWTKSIMFPSGLYMIISSAFLILVIDIVTIRQALVINVGIGLTNS